MSRVPVCLVTLACVLAAGTVPAKQESGVVSGLIQAPPPGQPPRDNRPAAGRSVIRGRVIGDNGQPLRKATVRANAPEARGQHATLTDTDGRYEFNDLPAGRYTINAFKAAYLNWSYGQTQPNRPGKTLALADKQVAENIDVTMPRGSVITGRITDEFGDPTPNAQVVVMRQQFVQGQRRLQRTGGGSANDIGEYRLFGLAPGQYYVAATAPPGLQGVIGGGGPNVTVENSDATRGGYAPTYYPGTVDAAAAQRTVLGLAQTATDVDITLVPTRLASISGVAVDAQGKPLAGGSVTATLRGGINGLGPSFGAIRPDGTFTIPNLAPGEYTVRGNTPRLAPVPGQPPAAPDFSLAIVTITGDDVAGVLLSPIVRVTLSGRVTFTNPAAAQAVTPSAFRINAQSLDPDNGIGPVIQGPAPPVNDDLTFQLKVLPGTLALRVNAPPVVGPTGATSWQLNMVRVNGRDVTDTGIEVGTRDLGGVEIELTDKRQQVSGRVLDSRGETVTDYEVLIFAQDRSRWTAPLNRYLGIGRPGDQNQFKIGTLPPGQYYAVAVERADAGEWQDPEFLDGLSRAATSFSLGEGEMRTLDLRLVAVQ
jgi:hypothetical protein